MISTIILGGLGLLLLYFVFYLVRDLIAHRDSLKLAENKVKLVIAFFIGIFTDFLDTLGVGSFAPTAMLLDMTKNMEHDRQLPGTLNVAHTIPVMLEAFIFIAVVKVEPMTLFSLIVAAIVGSWVGSRTVSKMPEKKIQFYMGIALIVTAVLMGLRQQGMLDALGAGNEALGLEGGKLVIGIVGNFIFGALMTIGVGLYAPCMAMVYMLGMSPLVAFPIMMASCAGLMPVASAEFIKSDNYSRINTIGIIFGGIIGVIIAAYFVTNLNMDILVWIIIAVVIWSGIIYIRKGLKKDEPETV
ncbi:sulfite exporter TauE/SafE family protein [Vagococcus acidifermentans]|uniref:Probable membrane transporter protein n=1 Tax=Vagococcus acidifermentans TaxID=564710 RepID=A0A430B267_9ENTE|nr:sulfite exporter TauE/SafE family protein [Vagococcus acidifermentans]RSU14424.1 permease [Vagococcus acidifermentans]